MVVVKFNQSQEVQLASQLLNVDVKELSLIPQISKENYDFEEIASIYKDYLNDSIEVCSCCRAHNTEVDKVEVFAGNWDNPSEYDNVCECGKSFEGDKPTLEEWLFITL